MHGFLAGVEGVDFTKKVTRGIRADRYEAECPSIVGPVSRRVPIFADDVRFAKSLGGAVKITIPGPMTIVDTLYDAHYSDRRTAALAFAQVIREEAEELVAAGVDAIQLDEPAFNVYFEEVEDWGIAALDAAIGGLNVIKAVHICYGYGIEANNNWKKSLGTEWDQYAQLFPFLSQSCVDQVSIELAGSRVPPEVLSLLHNKDAAIGVIDVATDRVETPQDVLDNDSPGREIFADGTHLVLDQLRNGSDAARARVREAASAWRRCRTGARSRNACDDETFQSGVIRSDFDSCSTQSVFDELRERIDRGRRGLEHGATAGGQQFAQT